MKNLLLLITALGSFSFISAQTYDNSGTYLINEIIASPSNSDSGLINITDNSSIQDFLYDTDETLEYFEFRGPADGVIPNGTYFITIDGDGDDSDVGNNIGLVREVIDLSGLSFGSNGILSIVANVTFTAGSTDQDGNVITVTTTIENPYAAALAASDANVITVGVTATPEWTDEETIGVPVNETLRRFNTITVTSNDIGYDGNFSDQSNNFMLIQSSTPPSKDSMDRVDMDENGVLDPTGQHTDWTILDSVSILDNDDNDASANEVGEFAYGQIVFYDDTPSSPLNLDPTVSTTLIPLDDDANYVARSSDDPTYIAETDWIAARTNSNSFPDWAISGTDTRQSPSTLEGNIPLTTYGNINNGYTGFTGGQTLTTLSTNEFTINGTKLSAYPVPMIDKLTVSGLEIDTAVIYNLTGAIVSKSNNNEISVSDLSSGVYILEIESNGSKASNLVVKQ
ncbi:T9SS type A sorting domain-containing protein [uncultured Aquimarina sp.]|uniref:T9SS type A sorting domain-containing protein n=1 Tax=uncultured Aquimarina sp. TaxID=575652 RepID=UPI002616C2CF|nr:T9SS type A sorting domain-containing protein [uncultured Aquimarina sp.]